MTGELTALSAIEIVQRVHDGSLTSSEVASCFLDRIEKLNPLIQAFVTVNPELVRAEATWRDQQAAAGMHLPLHGVPIGVKDNIDAGGLPTIAGFEPFRNNIRKRDAAIVEALRSLGAVILGKTHTTPFAMRGPVPTKNPWNLKKSPAASSAGSGAAVAARMAPVTLGTQTGGSTLRPAAFNGVVGFKPTYDWFSVEGVIPVSRSIDHLGIFGSTVGDVMLVYHSLLRIDGDLVMNATPPTLAILTEFLEMSSPEIATHLNSVADVLKKEGATIIRTQMPDSFDHIFALHQIIVSSERAAVHSANLSRFAEYYAPEARLDLEADALIPATSVLRAKQQRQTVSQLFRQFLGQFDAVLLPTVSTLPCDRSTTGDFRFQMLATLLGVPAISLPTGLSSEGLPFAVQLIGDRGTDSQVLSVAKWVSSFVPSIGSPNLEPIGSGS